MDELLTEFLSETGENLGLLDRDLVALEERPNDPALLGSVFRIFHTIKGTCGFLGLPRLEQVAHAAENALGEIRSGAVAASPDTVSPVFDALDRIKEILAGLARNQKEPQGDDAPLVAALNRLGRAPPQLVTPAPAETALAAVMTEPRADSIRVKIDLLEELLALVSELVLTRNQLMQTLRDGADSVFSAPLHRLSHVTTELQEGLMKTRMQPIRNAWAKLPRLVRDLARELGKKLELRLTGADTALDSYVLELVKDPLTHMVRNCADHGIEAPAERAAAGKPEAGLISLEARHAGGFIMVEVADDGRGIDLAAVARKAVAQGLASVAEIAQMSGQQIQRFLFRPGFTTVAAVTSVSGRGVGLDVVRTNIEKIGGRISLASETGRGSCFTIAIPLTLAIVAALIVECGGVRFAFPQIAVVELVRISRRSGHTVEWVHDAPILRLRESILPLVPLRALLGLQTTDPPRESVVIVTQVGARHFGIIADRVVTAEEIVVKRVAPLLRDIAVYSGNTVLGDGSVIMILDPKGVADLAAVAAAGPRENGIARGSAAMLSEQQTVLLFRAGGAEPKAVPLAMVTRLETVDMTKVERAGGKLVVHYRGRPMPLLPLAEGQPVAETGERPVLVFVDGERSAGLLVDEIIDVVEEHYVVELRQSRPGILGSAIIGGRVADLIDVPHHLKRSGERWFDDSAWDYGARGRHNRVLLVDDSAFFRNMLRPLLNGAGYDVTAAASVDEALALCAEGETFDVIVSDIEMPRTDGFGFAAKLRGSPAWAGTPLIALTSHATERDRRRTRLSGFNRPIPKSDHQVLLKAISETIAARAVGMNGRAVGSKG
jgi:two-component system, chemotaxis family, sensor kinase CheA